jgi:anti-anti-sigma factor
VAAPGSIEIQIHSPGICSVALSGEHDAAASEAVTLALAAARGYHGVLVDLTHCTFIDSTLITALLVGARRARERGGALELVLPEGGGAVRRTLEVANVQMLLPFHASRPAAIAALKARGRADVPRPRLRDVSMRDDIRRAPSGTTIVRARIVNDGSGPDGRDALGGGAGGWGEGAA